MAPIRRYLRITKYSVLEVRIYLDNPHLAETWLLNTRRPVLPRVMQSVQPLVLPKLREENERRRKGAGKKKSVKDTVVEDDFEVSIFLTDNSSRHALLTKHKTFQDETHDRLKSNSSKLTGDTQDDAVDVDEDASKDNSAASTAVVPQAIREESASSEDVNLVDVPAADPADTASETGGDRTTRDNDSEDPARSNDSQAGADSDDEDDLFVAQEQQPRRTKRQRAPSQPDLEGSGDVEHSSQGGHLPKRARRSRAGAVAAGRGKTGQDPIYVEAADDGPDDGEDDKKKMALNTVYHGYTIYGHILCLIVRKCEGTNATGHASGKVDRGKGPVASGNGKAMMEDWIASTQVPLEALEV